MADSKSRSDNKGESEPKASDQRTRLESAIAHHTQGRLSEAEALYKEILSENPRQPTALHLLGVIAHQVGKHDIAADLITRALSVFPDYAEAHSNLGLVLRAQGNLEDAISHYRRATEIKPDYADAWMNLGNALRAMGKSGEAIKALQRALKIKSPTTGALNNLGLAYKHNGQAEEAIRCFRQALKMDPGHAAALYNMGNTHKDLGHLDDAIASYEAALAIKSDYAEAHNNMGNALRESGEFERAIEAFKQAIAVDPVFAEAYDNMGFAYQCLGKMGQAIEAFRKTLDIKPDFAGAHVNLGMALLLCGDFTKGWEHYAWRWKTGDPLMRARQYDQPMWNGSPLDGKTIYVYPEQGAGDCIQFSRYVPLLEERGARVVLETPVPLFRLFEAYGWGDRLVKPGAGFKTFDYHAPMLELPRLCDTTVETIPQCPPPSKDAFKPSEALQEVLDRGEGIKVGLVWAGNPGHKNDHNRSIPIERLAPLFKLDSVSWFSLQMGRDGEAVRTFGDAVTDLAPHIHDFADTAAAMVQLDVVVSVDTSAAHLAGMLGCPTWVLLPFNPDWRWLLGRDDSPWYPTARLFRQSAPGAWDEVLQGVCGELAHMKTAAGS